jgi:dsRNA-specific ribonuclease
LTPFEEQEYRRGLIAAEEASMVVLARPSVVAHTILAVAGTVVAESERHHKNWFELQVRYWNPTKEEGRKYRQQVETLVQEMDPGKEEEPRMGLQEVQAEPPELQRHPETEEEHHIRNH